MADQNVDSQPIVVLNTENQDGNPLSSKKGKKRKNKKTRGQRRQEKLPKPDYEPFVRENLNLYNYYRQQPIFDNEEEFKKFFMQLKVTLPANFRINTFDIEQANFLRHLIEGPELSQFLTRSIQGNEEHDCDKKSESIVKEDENSPSKDLATDDNDHGSPQRPLLEPLCWYPKRLGWQMNASRLDLKKAPILQQFHRFLMAETDNGFISRQEAVSMIPPLLLDIKHGQDILDMCAAPGSKTAQLLEYLTEFWNCSRESCDKLELGKDKSLALQTDLFDDGMVVANDVDNKRCYMLAHQSNRLNSPNCIIINEDASKLPNLKRSTGDDEKLKDLKFDRILCDVPCSGDGTIRKNPDVWKKWSVANASNFHGMQSKILRRGVELLKENGLLVYSTCSMMPTEDEAVISSILRASEGTIVLEDASHRVPGLKFKPGTSSWIVMNQKMEVFSNVDKVPPENAAQMYPSLFPPSEEEKESFKLHKCMRVLPHLQNTGGFFVAVLRKLTSKLPWEEIKEKKVTDDKPVVQQPRQNPKKRRFNGFKEDPFIFMESNDPDWDALKKGYGLSDSFPVGQLVHRCSVGKKRSIYLVSKRTRNFIISNREEPGRADFVKIINGGMRLFSRADTGAGFRICQDGVNEILPYIKDDIKVPINKTDLIALLKSRGVSLDLLSSSQHIKENIKAGSFILVYKHETEEDGPKLEMPLVAWKGEYTVALYVSKTYRVHLCALAQVKIDDDGVTCCSAKQEEQQQQL